MKLTFMVKRNSIVFVGAILTVLLSSVAGFPQLNRTSFYGENPMGSRIVITNSMMRALKRAPDFSWCYDENTRDRTQATKVDVNIDGIPEILVSVECGNSATSFLFWLLKRNGNGYQSIFNIGTMGVYFQRKRHYCFRDIFASGCTANTCFNEYFSFNGQRYKRTKHLEKPVP